MNWITALIARPINIVIVEFNNTHKENELAEILMCGALPPTLGTSDAECFNVAAGAVCRARARAWK